MSYWLPDTYYLCKTCLFYQLAPHITIFASFFLLFYINSPSKLWTLFYPRKTFQPQKFHKTENSICVQLTKSNWFIWTKNSIMKQILKLQIIYFCKIIAQVQDRKKSWSESKLVITWTVPVWEEETLRNLKLNGSSQ